MNRKFKTLSVVAFSVIAVGGALTSCVADPNSPGVEYMPDMYRSPAVETYVDYGQVKGKYDLELVASFKSGLPPVGVVPHSTNAINDIPYQHGMPIGFDKSHGLYGVADSNGRANAANDINPIAYTEEVKKEAKEIYGNFCIHCHGEKGDGQGSVIKNSDFGAPPAYNSAALKDLPAGQIFYSITYGKGLMGSHASQLSKEERWKVVHHIQLLQGKEKVFAGEEPTMESASENEAESNEEENVVEPAHADAH